MQDFHHYLQQLIKLLPFVVAILMLALSLLSYWQQPPNGRA